MSACEFWLGTHMPNWLASAGVPLMVEKIAIASVVAFTISETVEALVFTPLRKRSLTVGVALSATVGNALDSYIFLTLAFGSLAFFPGQFWAKSEAIAVGVALTAARRFAFPVARPA